MNFEVELLRVPSSTDIAFVNLSVLRGVQLEMLRQVAVLSKAPAADSASVGLFTGVNPHVIENVPGLFKQLIASRILAFQESLSLVAELVQFINDFVLPV
jgi:hypothetical protein